jgi:hypothetical protein
MGSGEIRAGTWVIRRDGEDVVDLGLILGDRDVMSEVVVG